ncbi:MAG: SMC family ATPase [Methanobacteriota archaeon]
MLSAINTSERRVLILRMLGIDAIDKVIKEIGSDKRQKETLVEKIRADLIDEHGKNKVERYIGDLKNLEIKKENFHQLIERMKDKIIQHKKDVERKEKECTQQKKEYELLRQKMEQLTEKKALYEKKQKLQENITVLEEKIRERKKHVDEHEKKLTTFSDIDQETHKLEQRLRTVKENHETLMKTIEQRKTIIEQRKIDIKEIEAKKKRIARMGPDAECPTCERVLGKQHDILVKKFDHEHQQKHTEITRILQELKTKQGEDEQTQREEVALQKKKDYLQKMLREKERLLTIVRNTITEMKREQKELETNKKQLKEIGSLVFNQDEYLKMKHQVETTYKTYQTLLASVNEKKEIFNRAQLDHERKESEKKLILQQITMLQQRIEELEKRQKQIENDQKTVQYLSMLNEVMSNFRTYLISRIRPTLSFYASDFFGRLTDGKYQEIELDEDYNIQIYDEGTCYTIDRFSGGEEDLANLCLRLAISEVITERAGGVFNFIILDEIFGSQDMIRRQSIMKALNSLSSKFRQIFLITHVDEIKNDIEHTITVVEDNNGVSTITIN